MSVTIKWTGGRTGNDLFEYVDGDDLKPNMKTGAGVPRNDRS